MKREIIKYERYEVRKTEKNIDRIKSKKKDRPYKMRNKVRRPFKKIKHGESEITGR